MNTYHIVRKSGEYWSIGKKRWGKLQDATVFSEADASNLTLPNGGEWAIIT